MSKHLRGSGGSFLGDRRPLGQSHFMRILESQGTHRFRLRYRLQYYTNRTCGVRWYKLHQIIVNG